MVTLRGRAARHGLSVVRVTSSTLGVGLAGIDPNLPQEQLEPLAVNLRRQIDLLAAAQPPPRNATIIEDPGAPVPGEWVITSRSDPDRVVLHLHGGAYILCSPRTHRFLTAALASTAQARVWVPDYRMAPEHRFPAAVDDAVRAYRWLTESLRIEPARMAVTGDSAGGGLGLALLVRLRDEGLPLPACYGGLSPWTDLTSSGESHTTRAALDPLLPAALVGPAARGYAGDTPLEHPLISPLFADLRGLPPMLIQAGTEEILHSDSTRLVDNARAAGVDASFAEFHGMFHVFQAVPMLPESRAAVGELGGFIRRHAV